MHISEKAIEYPRLVLLGALLVCIIGAMAVLGLPKERTPRVKVPVIIVGVPNPGADPYQNERNIVKKIEDEADSLDNLKEDGYMLSQSVNGAAVVQFFFDDSVIVREAKRDVEEMINRVKGQFPPEAQADPGPSVLDVAFEDYPIIQVIVAGGDSAATRKRVADKLESRIKVAGISQVDVFGGDEREVHIEIDPNRMVLSGFSYDDIAAAVSDANFEAPSGSIEGESGGELRVRTGRKLGSLAEIERVPLGVRNGKLMLVQDVADVRMGIKPRSSLAFYDNEEAIVLLARAKTDVDVLAAANRIQKIVDDFVANSEHEGTHINTMRSQAREIMYMISQLGWSAGYGTVLVFLILFAALGWRNALLIGSSVPFALLGAVAVMWFAKQTVLPDIAINNMTLFATILVIGMIVDGCIIVGENIYRHRELGRSPVDAAKRGIREVGGALVAAYLTTIAAFVPMFMVSGIMGDFMQLLPIVVIFSLCAAMLVDHFILPVLSVYMMSPRRIVAHAPGQDDEHTSVEAQEIASAEAIGQSTAIKRAYGRMMHYALHHRLLVMTLAVITAALPVALFWIGAIGFEFFPEGDVPIVEVYYELPLGSSLEKKTADVGKTIVNAVRTAVREEEWYRPSANAPRARPVLTIGEPGALATRLDGETGAGPEFGMVYCELELAEHRERSAAEIRRAIAAAIPPLPGVIVRVKSPSEGPPTGADIAVRVLAQEQTTIEQLAERADEIAGLLATVPGLYDVTTDFRLRPEYDVQPNDEIARLYDLEPSAVQRAAEFALEGKRIGEVDFGGEEDIDIRIRNRAEDRDERYDLENLPLLSPTGKRSILGQVASIDRVQSANTISHRDGRRVVTVRADKEQGVLTDDVKASIVGALRPELTAAEQRTLVLDKDAAVVYSDESVLIEFGGENEIRDDALADLNMALVLAAGLMLIILVVQFNSFVQPAIILFSVPLSLVGVTLGLMLCGFYFSISAMIGVVALSGVVVNDAIVLVDFINRLHRAGLPIERAVIRAGQMRLRPIFLTTVTTIGGLLPLSLNLAGGGEFWQPLTVTVIFGLLFATLLQLILIPIMCYSFMRKGGNRIFDPLTNPALAQPPRLRDGATPAPAMASAVGSMLGRTTAPQRNES